jgi:hypothetical protein
MMRKKMIAKDPKTAITMPIMAPMVDPTFA